MSSKKNNSIKLLNNIKARVEALEAAIQTSSGNDIDVMVAASDVSVSALLIINVQQGDFDD